MVIDRALALFVIAVGSMGMAHAEWQNGELPLDLGLHAWFQSLHSVAQTWCCDEGDGRPADAWEVTPSGYSVTVYGKTFAVPKSALVTGANRMGEPIVWTYPLGSKEPEGVRCFLPGTLG